jgi:hypothetical protein
MPLLHLIFFCNSVLLGSVRILFLTIVLLLPQKECDRGSRMVSKSVEKDSSGEKILSNDCNLYCSVSIGIAL